MSSPKERSEKERTRQVYERREFFDLTGGVFRPGGFVLTDRAVTLCAFNPGARVLDVGCGAGATVEHLITRHHLDAVGVDISGPLLEYGRRSRPGLPLLQASGEELPFPDGKAEGILTECSLSVMENTELALQEFFRVLQKGGRLAISDVYIRNPEGSKILGGPPSTGCLAGALPLEELIRKVCHSGFEIVLWEDHSRLLAEFVGRLILAGASPDTLWGMASCGNCGCTDIREMIKTVRPGYLLLIARKAAP